jgi:endonuclease/exonuclease/phosphatase family metal-dependent hydrolase
VTFNGLAAEVDAPRTKKTEEWLADHSFWRAPYMASFRSGNFDFIVIATHIRWGESVAARQAELQLLADWIDVRFKNEFVEDNDLIVMGDFNIPKLGDPLFKALTSRGLMIPSCLTELRVGDRVIGGSNLGTDARYDQILHLPTLKDRFTNEGGALDFFISDARIKELFPSKDYTRLQFSYQLSDHFPVWAQIKTDIEEQRLTQIIQNAKK